MTRSLAEKDAEIATDSLPSTSPTSKEDESGSGSITELIVWVGAAVAFGGFIGLTEGSVKCQEYFAGYLLEQSLSIDNLFVFVLVFSYFKVRKDSINLCSMHIY